MQTIKVSFSKIHEVKRVPGVPPGQAPGFFQRYTYWRQCCLFSSSIFGLFLVLSCIGKDALRIRSMNEESSMFPEELREHFKYYIWLLLGLSCFISGVTTIVVLNLWAACCWQAHIQTSMARGRHAWSLLILGPFVPYLVIPLGASFSTEALQRDICAVTLKGLLSTSMSRGFMQEAAPRVQERELGVVALHSVPKWGTPEFKEWQGREWCKEKHSYWEEVLFSSEWVKAAYTNFRDPRMTLPLPGESKYPGVVPEMIKVMMGSIGVLFDPAMRFCYDDFLLKAQQIKNAFKTVSGKDKTVSGEDLMEEASGQPEVGEPPATDKPAPPRGPGQPPMTILPQGHRQVEPGVAFISDRGDVRFWPHLAAERGNSTVLGNAQGERSAVKSRLDTSVLQTELRTEAEADYSLNLKAAHGSEEQQLEDGSEEQQLEDGRLEAIAEALSAPSLLAAETEGRASLSTLGIHATSGPSGLSTFTKIALSAVCYTFRGALSVLRIARLTNVFVMNVVGLHSAVQCVKLLGLSIFSVVDGLVEGVVTAKKVVPSASLPGHILSVAVITSLAPILLLLATLSQMVAHPAFSAAITCVAAWRVLDLWRAVKMKDTRDPKKSMEEFDRLTLLQSRLLRLGFAFLVVYVLRMHYVMNRGGGFLGKVDVKDLFEPIGLVQVTFRFVMVRILTLLVTTDLVLEAIFDSADDELLGEGCGNEDLINGWRRLNGLQPIAHAGTYAPGPGQGPAPGQPGGPPLAPPRPPPATFVVRLEKGAAAKLGVVVEARAGHLEIEEITGGLVGGWNQMNPMQKVQVGDRIVAVNGVSVDTDGMREELRSSTFLELVLQRDVG